VLIRGSISRLALPEIFVAPACLNPSHPIAASSGNSEFQFNAKAQRRQDAKPSDFLFATLRPGVSRSRASGVALNPFAIGAVVDINRRVVICSKYECN
jgi:hypothetical protein